jgi:hypothetical protein
MSHLTRSQYQSFYVQLVAAAMQGIIGENAVNGHVNSVQPIAREACDYADAALDEILNRSERPE